VKIMTSDGYPEEHELKYIREYDLVKNNPGDLLEYIKAIWRWEDYFVIKETGKGLWVEIHTGGWSGHEEMIGALQETLFFSLFWKMSKAGGHHYFRVEYPRDAKKKEEILAEKHLPSLILSDLHAYLDGEKSGMRTAQDIVELIVTGIKGIEEGVTIQQFLDAVNIPERPEAMWKKRVEKGADDDHAGFWDRYCPGKKELVLTTAISLFVAIAVALYWLKKTGLSL